MTRYEAYVKKHGKKLPKNILIKYYCPGYFIKGGPKFDAKTLVANLGKHGPVQGCKGIGCDECWEQTL